MENFDQIVTAEYGNLRDSRDFRDRLFTGTIAFHEYIRQLIINPDTQESLELLAHMYAIIDCAERMLRENGSGNY